MRISAICCLLGVASATTLKVTWSDCGDSNTHGVVHDLEPATIETGVKTRISGSGSVDIGVGAGTFRLVMKSGWIPLLDHTGDLCSAESINLPLGVGSIDWQGLNCPQAAGDVTLAMDMSLASSIPSALLHTTTTLTAVDGDGNTLMCVTINTAAESDLAEASMDALTTVAVAETSNEMCSMCVGALGEVVHLLSSETCPEIVPHAEQICDASVGAKYPELVPVCVMAIKVGCPLAASVAGHVKPEEVCKLIRLCKSDLADASVDALTTVAVAETSNEMLGVASGTTLKVTWSDCGDSNTHGVVHDLEPATIETGVKTRISGSGSVDIGVGAGTFHLVMKSGWIPLLHHTGDLCSAESINLPLGVGSIDWQGLNCPQAAGDVTLAMDMSLASSIPSALLHTTTTLTAVDGDGNKLLCVTINTAAESLSSLLV